MRFAIVTTHPIQYYAPVFKLLAGGCELKVFYTWGEESIKPKFDPGFGKTIEWDIPLLDGYDYEFLNNVSKQPGSHHFKGIKNPDVIQRIDAFQPHVILVYGWAYQSHLKILRHFKGKIPTWFRGDSNLIDKSPTWKSLLKRIFLQWVYSHVDKAFYVGSANEAYFHRYGMKASQLVFAPHAIDIGRFAEDRSEEVLTLRKSLHIEETDILILFAGKLDLIKNPEILINAYAQLGQKNVHLLFVGNGTLEKKLMFLSKTLKSEAIHFLPFQNQKTMPVIYQSCDVFCLPSRRESWGLAVNEAMAAGKAIIASDKLGCATDLVQEGLNGYVFKSEDQADLLIKLKLACTSLSHLSKLGLQSKKIIENWSFDVQVTAIAKELDEYSKH